MMAHLWLQELMRYTGMGEVELSYCLVHLGFPEGRATGEGLRWSTWEVDRWLRAQPTGAAAA